MFLFDTYTTVIIVIKQLVRNFMLNALIPIVLLSLLFTKMHRDQEYLNLHADCLPETSCFYSDFQVEKYRKHRGRPNEIPNKKCMPGTLFYS